MKMKKRKKKIGLVNALGGGSDKPKKKKKQVEEAAIEEKPKKKKKLKKTKKTKKGKKDLAELKDKVKAERKKPKGRTIEFLDLKVEYDVEIPAKGRPSLKRIPFDKLNKKNASFFIPFEEMAPSQVNSAVGQENLRAEGKRKYIYRSVEGGSRVFRID